MVQFKQYLKQNKINGFQFKRMSDHLLQPSNAKYTSYRHEQHRLHNIILNEVPRKNDNVYIASGSDGIYDYIASIVNNLPGVGDEDRKKIKTSVTSIVSSSEKTQQLRQRFKKGISPETNNDLDELGKLGKSLLPKQPGKKTDMEHILETLEDNPDVYEHVTVETENSRSKNWWQWAKSYGSSFLGYMKSVGSTVLSWGKGVWEWMKTNWIYIAAAVLLMVIALCTFTSSLNDQICAVSSDVVQFCIRFKNGVYEFFKKWIQVVTYSNKDFVVPDDYNPFKKLMMEEVERAAIIGAKVGGTASMGPVAAGCAKLTALTSWAGPIAWAIGGLCTAVSTTAASATSYKAAKALAILENKSTYVSLERNALNILGATPILLTIVRRCLYKVAKHSNLVTREDIDKSVDAFTKVQGALKQADQLANKVQRKLVRTIRSDIYGKIDPEGNMNDYLNIVHEDVEERNARTAKRIAYLEREKEKAIDAKLKKEEKIRQSVRSTNLDKFKLESLEFQIQKLDAELSLTKEPGPTEVAETEAAKKIKSIMVNERLKRASNGKLRKEGGLDEMEVFEALNFLGAYESKSKEYLVARATKGKLREDLKMFLAQKTTIDASDKMKQSATKNKMSVFDPLPAQLQACTLKL